MVMQSYEEYKERLIQDLEEAYVLAMGKGNIAAALKAKELLAKEMGFLEKGRDKKEKLLEMLKSLSEGELEDLLEGLRGCV